MSMIKIIDIRHSGAETKASDPVRLSIDIQCQCALQEDMELKTLFVADGCNNAHDQVLDSVDIGPIQPGNMRFDLEIPPPDLTKMKSVQILDVTCIYISCLYKQQEFSRIGWYVRHEKPGQPKQVEEIPVGDDAEMDVEDEEDKDEENENEEEETTTADAPAGPPGVDEQLDLPNLIRIIDMDHPHVSPFSIKWDQVVSDEQAILQNPMPMAGA